MKQLLKSPDVGLERDGDVRMSNSLNLLGT